jgi:uncharacterized protein with HEPN domain
MRRDRERLRDILNAIEKIESQLALGQKAFDQSELIQTWMIRHLEVIGEAVAELSEATRALAPDVPWSKIVSMRNILIHEYFRVSLSEVWNAVQLDLPGLKSAIQTLLARPDIE